MPTPPVRRPYSETVAKVITVPPIETISDLVALLKEVLATVSWHEDQIGIENSWMDYCIPFILSEDLRIAVCQSLSQLHCEVDGAEVYYAAPGDLDITIDGMEFRCRSVMPLFYDPGVLFPGLPLLIRHDVSPK
jgi:hypothetical protein